MESKTNKEVSVLGIDFPLNITIYNNRLIYPVQNIDLIFKNKQPGTKDQSDYNKLKKYNETN